MRNILYFVRSKSKHSRHYYSNRRSSIYPSIRRCTDTARKTTLSTSFCLVDSWCRCPTAATLIDRNRRPVTETTRRGNSWPAIRSKLNTWSDVSTLAGPLERRYYLTAICRYVKRWPLQRRKAVSLASINLNLPFYRRVCLSREMRKITSWLSQSWKATFWWRISGVATTTRVCCTRRVKDRTPRKVKSPKQTFRSSTRRDISNSADTD